VYKRRIRQGSTVIGDGCEIGPDAQLTDCAIGSGAVVRQSVGDDAEVGADAVVGPYAHLPAGSSVPEGTITGGFYTAPV